MGYVNSMTTYGLLEAYRGKQTDQLVSVGKATDSASVGSANFDKATDSASVGSANFDKATDSASVGSANVGEATLSHVAPNLTKVT